jgi:hypothetical protein
MEHSVLDGYEFSITGLGSPKVNQSAIFYSNLCVSGIFVRSQSVVTSCE